MIASPLGPPFIPATGISLGHWRLAAAVLAGLVATTGDLRWLVVTLLLVLGWAAAAGAARWRRPRVQVAGVLVELVSDAAAVLLVVLSAGPRHEAAIWALLAVPVLEGAVRLGLRGAAATWLPVTGVYATALVQHLPADSAAFWLAAETVMYRSATVLLIAVPAGYLAEQLMGTLQAHGRARDHAQARALLLRRVTEIARGFTELRERSGEVVLPALPMLSGIGSLGFEGTDLCERDERSTWRRTASWPATESGCLLDRDEAAVAEAAWRAQAPQVRTASGGTAEVVTPLQVPGRTVVLRGSIPARSGPGVDPLLVEAVTLVASQASVALRNQDLLSQLRTLHAEVARRADEDPLTGLANRRCFTAALEAVVAHGGSAAVLLLDLDGFKGVNDTLGHQAGDELLTVAADRLRGCTRDNDLVARLGGDEFLILVREHSPITGSRPRRIPEQAPAGQQPASPAHLASLEQPASPEHLASLEQLTSRICVALSTPYQLAAGTARISTSAGVAATSVAEVDGRHLVARADAAMYQAKRAGKSRYRVWRPTSEPETVAPGTPR